MSSFWSWVQWLSVFCDLARHECTSEGLLSWLDVLPEVLLPRLKGRSFRAAELVTTSTRRCGPILPQAMAPSSGGWILNSLRRLRQMQSALLFGMEPCLTGRQGPCTQRPLSVWPEISDLIKGIVHERNKRIAKQTAVRRLLWPCCSMTWIERCEYGLPPEAELLASVARLEEELPSATGRAAVGMQDDLAKEACCLSEGSGQDCGHGPASSPSRA